MRVTTRLRAALVAAAALLVLAACGQAPSVAVTLGSANTELIRGAAATVEVTLTRVGGATADVTLAATGLPANVDATFAPAVLSGDTLTSTLTLSSDAAAAEGNYALSITATGTGLTSTADLALDVVSLAVTGRVVAAYDLPVVGASVSSQGESAVTAADGSFTLTGLAVPYDLSVWNTAGEWVQIYEGLTSAELLLSPLGSLLESVGTPRTATISGDFSGGVIPIGPNQTVMMCVEGLNGVAVGCATVFAPDTAYSFSADWFDDLSRTVRVHAIQVEHDAAGLPVSYQGYGSLDVTLTDGVPANADIHLGTAPDTTTVAVTVDSVLPILAIIGTVKVGPNLSLPVMQYGSADTAVDALMPAIPGSSYSFIGAVDTQNIGWQSEVTGAAASITIPDIPSLVTPAEAATGVTTATEFRAFNPSGGPSTFIWNANVGNLVVALTTMSATANLPELSDYGLALPTSTGFDWGVVTSTGERTEDASFDIGNYYRFQLGLAQSSPGPSGEGSFNLSAMRSFTTAP